MIDLAWSILFNAIVVLIIAWAVYRHSMMLRDIRIKIEELENENSYRVYLKARDAYVSNLLEGTRK